MRPLRPFVLLLALAATVGACDSGSGGSLYDPDDTGAPAPVIASVSPQGIVLAGIDEITITGQNFSATPSENVVFFDDGAGAVARGTVLAASATELRVKVPNLPNPALKLRVTVQGARDFSNDVAIPLTSAFVRFGDLDAGIGEEVIGITPDGVGGLFGSLIVNSVSVGVFQFAPDGSRTPFFSNGASWSDLAVAGDGALYGVRRVRAVFRLPEGGEQETVATFPNGTSLSTIEAGPAGALYAAGSSTSGANAVYTIDPDGGASATPFGQSVDDLTVFDGALYAAADDPQQVWRFPIGPDGVLGTPSLFYDVSADRGPSVDLLAIAFAADGTLYMGTNGSEPVLILEPGAATSAPLYPGVLRGPASELAWAPGSRLYVVRPSIVVNREIEPADLILLETRRTGTL